MSARSVLVTGGGGFIGSTLAETFHSLGWDVTAVDRHFDPPTEARLRGVRLVVADVARQMPAVPDAKLVVHAAATTTDATILGLSEAAHIAANLTPFLTTFAHAEATADAFVFLSSTGVFASTDAVTALTDTTPPRGRSAYAVAKRAGELIVLEGASRIAAHVVRLGYLYGPHEAARPSRTRVSLVAEYVSAARAARALEVRSDDPARDWTFAPDLAPALAALVAAPAARQPLHLGSGLVMRDSEVASAIAATSGARLQSVSAGLPLKPPMAPSDIAALRGFVWTGLAAGLARMAGREVVA